MFPASQRSNIAGNRRSREVVGLLCHLIHFYHGYMQDGKNAMLSGLSGVISIRNVVGFKQGEHGW